MSEPDRRPNKRGEATRQAILDAALEGLASGEAGAVSANQIAKRAGVTWGAVKYQFGDVDGLWADLLALFEARRGTLSFAPADGEPLAETVERIVTALWRGLDHRDARAIDALRSTLPPKRDELETAYPRTAAALAAWNDSWVRACAEAFAGLSADPDRIHGVASLVPGAIRGLTAEGRLSTYVDVEAGRRALAAAVTAYLAG